MKVDTLAMIEKRKVRFLKSSKSNIGDKEYLDQIINKNPIPKLIINANVINIIVSVDKSLIIVIDSTEIIMKHAKSEAPTISIFFISLFPGIFGIDLSTKKYPIIPIGTFIKNIDCQPNNSVNIPPKRGPTTRPEETIRLFQPIAFPRLPLDVNLVTMATPFAIINEAPVA